MGRADHIISHLWLLHDRCGGSGVAAAAASASVTPTAAKMADKRARDRAREAGASAAARTAAQACAETCVAAPCLGEREAERRRYTTKGPRDHAVKKSAPRPPKRV